MRRNSVLRRKVGAALVAIVAAVATAACGAGGESGTTSDAIVSSAGSGGGAPINKALFIKRGDAICTRTSSHISESLALAATKLTAGGKSLTRADEKKLIQTITAPSVQRMAADLGKLLAPDGAEKAASSLIGEFKAAAIRIEKNPSLGLLTENPLAAAGANAAAFGFEACSLV
jgi:hypothetical protein